MKLGQKVEFKNEFTIETLVLKDKLTVKKGDCAIVTKNGFKMLSGDARGKIMSFNEHDEEPREIDYENIAKLIYQKLNNEYDISEFITDYDVDKKYFIETIEEVIMDIL